MHHDGGTGLLGHIFSREKLRIYSLGQLKYLYPKKLTTLLKRVGLISLIFPKTYSQAIATPNLLRLFCIQVKC
tara:strand:+ start:221 stop:439 length:219 start_codon:yes stop_codon:yes gene_type:complete